MVLIFIFSYFLLLVVKGGKNLHFDFLQIFLPTKQLIRYRIDGVSIIL